jgi:hypothetical protein
MDGFFGGETNGMVEPKLPLKSAISVMGYIAD